MCDIVSFFAMDSRRTPEYPKYSVRVLKLGEAEVPKPEVYWMTGWGEWEKLFFYMVVVRGDGVTAIINTGPPEDLSDLNARWSDFAGPRCEFKREDAERPENALRSAGIRAEDVTHVLLTPLQLYTTANVAQFPNAKICFSRRGWIEDIMARPGWLHVPREQCISDEMLKFLLFEAAERLVLLEEQDEVCPGIRAWWVGTHHRSSMLYLVDTQLGVIGISDCAFTYGNLDGHPLGIAESLAEGHAAYARIRKLTTHFIPLYDPAVLDKYPGGILA